MINVSQAWQRALANDNRAYQYTIVITLEDGTVLNVDNSKLWQGTLKIDDAVSSDSDFQIGSAIINKCNFSLNNIYGEYDEYDFQHARVTLSIGLQTEEDLETIRKGTYVIVDSPTYNGELINIECLDYMYFFDVDYSANITTYPATADLIVRDMCTDLGIGLHTYDFPYKDTIIQERPNIEDLTYREMLSYVAQICGCYARCNPYGQLELKWFDQASLNNAVNSLDGGVFDEDTPYSSGDSANGGTFNPWNTGTVVDGGTFEWNTSVHYISSLYSKDISVDDVVITGVRILVKTKDESGSTDVIREFMQGTSGYVVEISDNPLITEANAQTFLTRLSQQLINLTFRKAKISHGSDPSIEAGDVAVVFDRKGGKYPILISGTVFSSGAAQETVSSAQTPTRNNTSRRSSETKTYVEMRQRLQNERASRMTAEAQLRSDIANSNGLYETNVTDESTGAVTRYLHNKPLLADSAIQIVISDVGVNMTPDSGAHWYGLNVNGDLIARILTATGINADWIDAGQLIIRDSNGNVTFFADTATGIVRIVASEFSLSSGDTIQSIANAAVNNLEISGRNLLSISEASLALPHTTYGITLSYDGEGWFRVNGTWNRTGGLYFYIWSYTADDSPWREGTYTLTVENDNLLVDGVLRIYYSTGTINPVPVGSTTFEVTSSLRSVGMYFVAGHSGAVYDGRFRLKLERGNKATADWTAAPEDLENEIGSKRRVFVTQPTPPYDVGDLWSQGSTGHLMRCKTSKASGSYSASDWERASKYTDDTEAENAKKVATNYLSYDSTGVMVANMYGQSTPETPSAATGRNVFITSNEVQIRDGQTAVAKFGESATIGKNESERVVIQKGGISFYNQNNINVMRITSVSEDDASVTVSRYKLAETTTIRERLKNGFLPNQNLHITLYYRFSDGATLSTEFDIYVTASNKTIEYRGSADKVHTDGTVDAYDIYVDVIYRTYDITFYLAPNGQTDEKPYAVRYSISYITSGAASSVLIGQRKEGGTGDYSFSLGYEAGTPGAYSMSNGYFCVASGEFSHAEGYATAAMGKYSHAEGSNAEAVGFCSHAEGRETSANADYSFTSGLETVADSSYQMVIGQYNASDSDNQFCFIAGNGLDWNHRSNGFTIAQDGSTSVYGRFVTSGTKSRLVDTDDYSQRLLYCYETPSPMFGDIGDGIIGDDGKCYVSIDPVFHETVNTSQYQVFLQKYGNGDCYVSERGDNYFTVSGTPGIEFGWEIKAKQVGMEQLRLETRKPYVSLKNETDYVESFENHLQEISKERKTA